MTEVNRKVIKWPVQNRFGSKPIKVIPPEKAFSLQIFLGGAGGRDSWNSENKYSNWIKLTIQKFA